MIDKNEVIELYKNGISGSAIAKKYNVSRQRIHQITKNYYNYGFQAERKKFSNLLKACEICNEKAINLHHRDYNNENDSISNLQPLCKKCHYKIHTNSYRKRWTRKYPACLLCKTIKYSHYGRGFCRRCYSKKFKNKYIRYGWSLKYSQCISCQTTSAKHRAYGLCINCFFKKLLTLPGRKEKHALAMKKYYIKQKSKIIVS